MSTFNLAALVNPHSIVVIGTPADRLQQRLADNLKANAPNPTIMLTCNIFDWPAAEMAVVFDARLASPHTLRTFGNAGGKALIWAAEADISEEALQTCREAHLRVLGPRSCGVITSNGSNATCLETLPPQGGIALIAQSRSIAAAIEDFAAGRHIGLRWMAVTGAERDVDAADLLDYAAVDPKVRAVVLEVGSISQARKFMSAARAAARIKPVAVLQRSAGGGSPDPVRSAAFMRAGLVECADLEGLFDTLEALDSLGELSQPRVTVVGNGAGLCGIAASSLARYGIARAPVSAQMQGMLLRSCPKLYLADGSVDLGGATAANTVVALRTLLSEADSGLLLLMHGPGMLCPQEELADALVRAKLGPRLIAVWPGLERAAATRRTTSVAGIATFATSDQAARAIHYRALHDQNRRLLMETPAVVAENTVARTRGAQLAAKYGQGNAQRLPETACCDLLEAYGLRIAVAPKGSFRPYRLAFACHAEFGMHLTLFDEASGALLATMLPPLDQNLIRKLLQGAELPDAHAQALAPVLASVSVMVEDQSFLHSGEHLMQVRNDGSAVDLFPGAVLWAGAPIAPRRRLAMASFPAALEHVYESADRLRYCLRPIRPSDEPALVGLFKRLAPDEVRYRFFINLRHFSHEMAARMTQIDYDRELALVAFVEGDDHVVVGTATLIADADDREAEFAVLVQASHTGHGLGRHLMTCLLNHAADRGISKVWGEVLRDNGPMLGLARSLGFTDLPDPLEPGCRRVEIDPRLRPWVGRLGE